MPALIVFLAAQVPGVLGRSGAIRGGTRPSR
jgi:hypothetical protein